MVLVTASRIMLPTSTHSSSGTLSKDLVTWICLSSPLYNHKGVDLGQPEEPSGFPYFLQSESEFGNKELMIWATVCSRSCFYWLQRFSVFGYKDHNQSDFSIDDWWCPCAELSLRLSERMFAMTSVFCWQKSVSIFPVSFYTPRPNLPVILSLDFLILHFNPLWWKWHLFLVLRYRRSYKSS